MSNVRAPRRAQPSPSNSLLFSLLLLISSFAYSQSVTVLDEDDAPLAGVEVFTADHAFAQITDIDGHVDISALAQQKVRIFFQFLGCKTRELTLEELSAMNHIVVLYPDQQMIDEIVVLGRKAMSAREIPFQIETIDQKEISSTNPQTSADALAQHGGVYVQKSQMGGGSPVIRGFEANRVLLVVDGIRMNNAIYRSGHLQNAITIDAAMLDRMEVLFGPNSLMYGSDALGGVVNFKTKQPAFSDGQSTKVAHGFYTRYSSANHEKAIHYDLNYGKQKWASITSISFVDYDDLRTGSVRDERYPDFGKRLLIQGTDESGQDIAFENPNPNIQVGTAYNQLDILQKLLFDLSQYHRLSVNVQYSTSSDIPRYDNLSEMRNNELRWAEWLYGPQRRLLASVDLRMFRATSLYDQLTIIGAFQKVDEDRISRRFGQSIGETQEEDVYVWSLTADASKIFGQHQRWTWQYGADMQDNHVRSDAWLTDITTGETSSDALSRYADGDNKLTNIGLYTFIKGKLDEGINLSGGLRYNISNYYLRYEGSELVDWPTAFLTGISGTNGAVTGSIGVTWQVSSSWQVRSMLSTAFRSPNIDDLSKIRINSNEITFPNLNLSPEQSKNAELTIAYQAGQALQISTTAYYTHLDDAITRQPYTAPDGSTTWNTQGETLLIVANQNVQSARILGMSANLSGKSGNWTYAGSVNVTDGKELRPGEESIPFAHIPPTYGKLSLGYVNQKWSLTGVCRYNGHKPLTAYGGSADNPDLTTPDGALGWYTLNLYGKRELTSKLTLSLGLENILDRHYRPFASGVSAPGRNLILAIRGNF